MQTCQECGGFVPKAQVQCPNCSAAVEDGHTPPSRGRAVKALIAGIAVPFTLMACYGTGPIDDPNACTPTLIPDGGGAMTVCDAGVPDGGEEEDAGQ